VLRKIYLFLISLVIFLIPSNLFLKLWENNAYVNGLLVDYLIPKLYLSDIFIISLLTIWIVAEKKLYDFKTLRLSTASFLVFLFIARQFFTINNIASLYYLAKIFEFSLFFIFLKNHKKLLATSHYALATSLVFQSLLAIYQFVFQKSLFGFWFFGETNLNNYAGIAKGVFNGVEKILPYGTTAHPNILAGFLAVGIMALPLLTRRGIRGRGFVLILASIALLLTQSWSAWLVLLLYLTSAFANARHPLSCVLRRMPERPRRGGWGVRLIVTLFVLSPILIYFFAQRFPQHTSLTRRDYLNQISIKMFFHHPILGVGLNNFTARVEDYGFLKETNRFIQPVHNGLLLILSETGILGIIIFLIASRKFSILNSQFLVILPLFFLDHYLLTSQTGLLLLLFFTVLSNSVGSTKTN